jgi:4-aminobutyrate aminotransferase-like enzyme
MTKAGKDQSAASGVNALTIRILNPLAISDALLTKGLRKLDPALVAANS